MGWQDSRFSLLAPGWEMIREMKGTEFPIDGDEPLQILRPERASTHNAPGIDPQTLENWFVGHGFEVRQRSPHGVRLQCVDVEAILAIKEEEVAEIILTFTLTRNSQPNSHVWNMIIGSLEAEFGMCLHSPETNSSISSDQFLRLLSNTSAWKDFSKRFGWDNT